MKRHDHKEAKRASAADRQAAHNRLTIDEKCEKANAAPGNSIKELDKLELQVTEDSGHIVHAHALASEERSNAEATN